MKITLGQLVGVIVLVAVVGVGAYFGSSKLKRTQVDGGKTRQAVFLTNGQVYFGLVKNEKADPIVLTDIYYLQVNQNLQNGDKNAQANQQQQVSLVKLGAELHGPKDEMRISRRQVVFIEDMKDDSQVNKAIANFVKNGSPTPTPAASPTK